MRVCNFPDRKYEIKLFSKSNLSVYFDDFRTNKKCKCVICKSISNTQCISHIDIIIVETKKQRQRNLKLNKILKNNETIS